MGCFTKKELEYISDTDFLLTKAIVTQKIKDILAEVEQGIKNQIGTFQIPSEVLTKSGKISKGENYQGLPYLILDYPRKFNTEEVFAFRTMFWWGQCFSATLHLGGKYWEEYRAQVILRQKLLTSKGWYICVNQSPWEYHYNLENYRFFDSIKEEDQLALLQSHPFLKLSRKWDLECYAKFPSEAIETFIEVIKLIDLT